MANLSIRGVEDQALERIKEAAQRRGQSVNAYVVGLIQRDVGLASGNARRRYDDLDHLAGTWSAQDLAEFSAVQKEFECIEEDLWA